jgi:hypothetical protein
VAFSLEKATCHLQAIPPQPKKATPICVTFPPGNALTVIGAVIRPRGQTVQGNRRSEKGQSCSSISQNCQNQFNREGLAAWSAWADAPSFFPWQAL